MNCDEYRKAVAAEPNFDGGAGHLAECADCRAYRSELLAFDDRIARALRITVPRLEMPELPEIATSNVVGIHERRRVPVRAWFAIAASVAVAAILGIRILSSGIEYESLADEVLAHIDHEPYSMRVTDVSISDERLRSVVAADVAKFDRDDALISYAQTCIINGRKVPHLVIQGEHGPVMILLLPDEKVRKPIPLSDDSIHGVILPVGDGSIAIVGGHDERLEDIEKTVTNSVTWSI